MTSLDVLEDTLKDAGAARPRVLRPQGRGSTRRRRASRCSSSSSARRRRSKKPFMVRTGIDVLGGAGVRRARRASGSAPSSTPPASTRASGTWPTCCTSAPGRHAGGAVRPRARRARRGPVHGGRRRRAARPPHRRAGLQPLRQHLRVAHPAPRVARRASTRSSSTSRTWAAATTRTSTRWRWR